jgi:hypothetical protein
MQLDGKLAERALNFVRFRLLCDTENGVVVRELHNLER